MNMTDYELYKKYNTLGKYSKMKISNFCGYRHEALGPPRPFVSNFARKKN